MDTLGSATIIALVGFLATAFIGTLGYMIRRAILVHDKNEVKTQEMITHNGEAAMKATTKAESAMVEAAQVAHTTKESLLRMTVTLDAVLAETRQANHRICKLEALEIVRREHKPEHHQQRGD